MRRRWPAALGVGAAVVFFADGRPEPLTAFAWILVAMAAAYPAIGLARRQLGSSRALGVQLGATVAFTAIAVAVMSLDDELGRYLLAAGWLAHGLWDVAHHRTGRVVPRQWAEWCGIVDILGAAAFVLLPAPA